MNSAVLWGHLETHRITASLQPAWCLPPASTGGPESQLNEQIRVALVGVGGGGEWFVDTIPRMEQVVAVCDVDQ